MILYMRTERTGLRRAALIAVALVAVLGGWWLFDGTSSPEDSTDASIRTPAPASHQSQVPPPALASVPVPLPAAAVLPPSPVPLAPAVTAVPSHSEQAATLPIPAPAEPQLPSMSTRGDSEPGG